MRLPTTRALDDLMPARARRRRRRERRVRMAERSSCTLAGAAGGAAIAFLLDPRQGRRRRHMLRDRAFAQARRARRRAARRMVYLGSLAEGTAQRTAASLHHEPRSYDDVTLARKVESEVFRRAHAPKGAVSVSAYGGVVELRGQLDDAAQIDELVRAAERVEGVLGVDCLLHTPDQPAPHAPPHLPTLRVAAEHNGSGPS